MESAIKLFNANLDGQNLSDDQQQYIDRWLLEDPDAAAQLAEASLLHELLAERVASAPFTGSFDSALNDFSASHSLNSQPRLAAPLPSPTRRTEAAPTSVELRDSKTKFSRPSLWAVSASILLTAGIAAIWSRDSTPHRFSVAESLDAILADGRRVDVGEEIPFGSKFHLTRGLFQVNGDNGTLLIVEAPAQLVFNSDSEVTLLQGKLLTRVESDSSFVVHTKNADVVDLGTEFGVQILDDASLNVVVYEGVVEVERSKAKDDAPLKLVAGRRAVVPPTGSMVAVAFDPSTDRTFVLPDEVTWRRQAAKDDSQADIDAARAALKTKLEGIQGLLAYQGFDKALGPDGMAYGFSDLLFREGSESTASMTTPEMCDAGGVWLDAKQRLELFPDVANEGRLATLGYRSGSGLVEQAGAELWIAWRTRHDSAATPAAGLSLSKRDSNATQELLFVGRRLGESSYSMGVLDDGKFKSPLQRFSMEYPLVSNRPRRGATAEESHLWIARLQFETPEDGRDSIALWCDGAWNNIEDTIPIIEVSAADIAFDCIRIAVESDSPGMCVDDVIMTERFGAILETLRAL